MSVTTASTTAAVRLKKNQDRRLRGGHPWIFSNEIEAYSGAVSDGGIVAIEDARGAFLGQGYLNRHSLIAVRLLTRGREPIDEPFFQKRLRRALAYREGLYPGDDAVRLVSAEGDFLPGLVVDRYGPLLAVGISTLGMEVRRELVIGLLEKELSPRSVILRADSPLRSLEGLPLERRHWSGEEGVTPVVTMGGLRFQVDPLGGQKTGLFLDQRDNRARLAGRVTGARVLDAFCYNGAWGLAALAHGAREAVFVDSSEPALVAAEENARLNDMSGKCQFLKDDAFNGLAMLGRTREKFDAVVVDPPALVKSKAHKKEGLRAYLELNRRAMALVADGGWLFTSSCSHAVSDEEFRATLVQAGRLAHRQFRLVEWGLQAQDHPVLLAAPETGYLKCGVLRG